MPELLCNYPNCSAYRDVEVPLEHIKFPITWYCYKHRGRNMFLPKPKTDKLPDINDGSEEHVRDYLNDLKGG